MPKSQRKLGHKPSANSLALHGPSNAPVVTTIAGMTVQGITHNAVSTVRFSASTFGEVDLTECVNALNASGDAVQQGDLGNAESLLMAQAVALNAIFNNLVLRSQANMGEYLDAADRYMRLGLKAQSQCRATLETLAMIKNPPAVFAKQANIAQGPQLVNNGLVTRAREKGSEPSELMEAHGERLDGGAAGKASKRNSPVAAVGALDRPADAWRQDSLLSERRSWRPAENVACSEPRSQCRVAWAAGDCGPATAAS